MKILGQSLGVFLLFSAVMFAQVQSGTIVGAVTDPTDAVIQGAKVTLRNQRTGFQRVVETNANGAYVGRI